MVLMSHGFGEHMCDLESISDMWEVNNLTVLNGVTINLYVLHVFVVDKIDSI